MDPSRTRSYHRPRSTGVGQPPDRRGPAASGAGLPAPARDRLASVLPGPGSDYAERNKPPESIHIGTFGPA